MALSAPVGKKPARTTWKSANQPVKRNINLISNRETQDRIAQRGAYVLLACVLALVVAYLGFVMPLMKKADLDRRAANAKSQAAEMQRNDATFKSLVAQRDSLSKVISSIDALDADYLSPTKINDMLEKACPDSVKLNNYMLNTNFLTLNGRAESDADIAQVLVNLQSSHLFAEVRVDSVTEAEAADTKPNTALAGLNRVFTITAVFPRATASPGASSAPSPSAAPADTKGGDGQ